MCISIINMFLCRRTLAVFFIPIPAFILYSQFLWNPVLFDDIYFFDGSVHQQYHDQWFDFSLRWLPFATFEWTMQFFGKELIWLRLGNLLLHSLNCITLFLFLNRIFSLIVEKNDLSIQPFWLAVFASLLFSLHPVSVYGVAYLYQRSILMATFFTLSLWRLFLEGLVRDKQFFLLTSVACYFFAVLSKEHSVMAPAIALAMTVLIKKVDRNLLLKLLPTLFLFSLVAMFVIWQVKSKHVLGQAYEPTFVYDQLKRFGADFNPEFIYPLSILTQSLLFFKYLLVWVIPNSSWLSVDIYEDFAISFFSLKHLIGFFCFLFYSFVAIKFLAKKGEFGLFGLALLCPWLLFFTEFSTVRIQESFVLYRSYLWAPGFMMVMPFLFKKTAPKNGFIFMVVFLLVLIPVTFLRLQTFSHPLLIWDDAAKLITPDKEQRPGVERIFYNRGTGFIRIGRYKEVVDDLTKVINISGDDGYYSSYSYNNRGAAYMKLNEYQLALNDFRKSIKLKPDDKKPYLGEKQALEALSNPYKADPERSDDPAIIE